MQFPSTLKYTKDHEWIRVEGDVAYIGVTDFAQSELGDIVYVDVPTLGQTIEQFSVFGTIEAVKTVSDLFSPITGKVIELNADLDAAPELVNQDAYGKGWIVSMSIDRPNELDELLDAEAYASLVGH